METYLQNVANVIDAIGGNSKVAKLTGRKDLRSAWNWRKANRFPADTFLILKIELGKNGFSAPEALWGFKLPCPPPPL
ncbi:MAG: hypothetical protein JSC189_000930 [Candidatus Tokpelaia sp. JSC189]|nr:MAG: hypothetical protein JSC189_000930 [Candidatus Tokpelaia sp. JSC189]